MRTIDLGEPSFCNDLTTDDARGRSTRDGLGAAEHLQDRAPTTSEVFATSPQFALDAPWAPWHPNGLDIAPGGEELLVVKTIPAALYRRIAERSIGHRGGCTSTTPATRSSFPGDPRFPGPTRDRVPRRRALRNLRRGRAAAGRPLRDDYAQAVVRTTTAVPTGLTSATVAEGRRRYGGQRGLPGAVPVPAAEPAARSCTSTSRCSPAREARSIA